MKNIKSIIRCPLSNKKKGGIAVPIMGMMLFILFALMATVVMRREFIYYTIDKVDDGLKYATLAGATVDLNEYGMNHNIIVPNNGADSYNMFRTSIQSSLGLANDFSVPHSSYISSPIVVEEYIIYNVRGSDIEIITYNNDGYASTSSGTVGTVQTENGITVTTTTIYAKISFDMKSLFPKKELWGTTVGMDDVHIERDSCIDVADNY